MKKDIFILFLLGFTLHLNAQIDFNSLEARSTPSATILGFSPSNIDRPSTPQAIFSSFQNAFNSGSSQFNPNINIEVTPFMAIPSKDYSLKKYVLDSRLKRNGTSWGMQMLRSMSVSFSTSQTDTLRYGTYKSGLGLAGGFRFCLFEYKIDKDLDSLMTKIAKDRYGLRNFDFQTIVNSVDCKKYSNVIALAEYLQNILDSTEYQFSKNFSKDVSKKMKALLKLKTDTSCNFFIDSLMNYLTSLRRAKDTIWVENIHFADSLSKLPSGFRLDYNMAYFGVLPGNDFKNPSPGGFALWLIPSYKIQQKVASGKILSIDFMLMGRITINQRKSDSLYIDTVNYLDVGGKVAFAYNKFNISAEAIYRVASKITNPFSVLDKKTWRITATASYKVTDFLSLQMTFGRNFDGKSATFDGAKNGPFIYLAGFNLGLASLSNKASKN